MLIVGAGGFASQLFDDLITIHDRHFVFWSETPTNFPCIWDNFEVLRTDEEVIQHFRTKGKAFIVGIWDIDARKRLINKFTLLGGELSSFITPFSYLSTYTSVGHGSVVLHKTASEPHVVIGDGCIINKRVNFGHGAVVSDFCSIGPYSIIGSDALLGENCYVGMGAIIQPKVHIGSNAIVSAGAVVTRNIEPNAVVSGVPAKVRFLRKDVTIKSSSAPQP